MAFQIDDSTPIPDVQTKGHNEVIETLNLLKPGQSFFIPETHAGKQRGIKAVVTRYLNAAETGIEVVMVGDETGLRIWRK